MDIDNFGIIVQYQWFGVVASKPELITHTDMM